MKKTFITLDLLVFILGLGLFTAGIYMIYPPAALIAFGMILMVMTVGGRK